MIFKKIGIWDTLLYQTAIELKMEISDEFYDLLSSMLERGTKPEDLSKEL